jgi:hypothetical protein
MAQLLDALLLAPNFYFQSLDPELEIVIACLSEGLRLNISVESRPLHKTQGAGYPAVQKLKSKAAGEGARATQPWRRSTMA